MSSTSPSSATSSQGLPPLGLPDVGLDDYVDLLLPAVAFAHIVFADGIATVRS